MKRFCGLAVLVSVGVLQAQTTAPMIEWPSQAGDQFQSRLFGCRHRPGLQRTDWEAGTAGESYLYVHDKQTGREVTRLATPYRPSGTPMTYVARSGRQFVVVATGAGPHASLVAFALR